MTYVAIIEKIQQHHPHLKQKEIMLMIRDAELELSESGVTTNYQAIDLTAGQRYYSTTYELAKVTEVSISGEKIPRLIGHPIIHQ